MNEWDEVATFDAPKDESWDSVATFDAPAPKAESWDEVASFDEPPASDQSRLSSGFDSFLSNVAKVGTSTAAGIARSMDNPVTNVAAGAGWALDKAYESMTGKTAIRNIPTETLEKINPWLAKLARPGESLAKYIEKGDEVIDKALPVNPQYQNELLAAKVPAVLGQAGGQLASVLVPGKALGWGSKVLQTIGLSQAGIMGLNAGYKEADRLGVTDPDKRNIMATMFGGIEAGTEAIGGFGSPSFSKALAGEMRNILEGNALKKFVKTAAGEGLEEVAAEVPQNLLSEGFRENDAPIKTSDPTKLDYWANLAETFGLGTVGGALFGGVEALADRRTPQAALAMRIAAQTQREELSAKQQAGQALPPEEAASMAELDAYDQQLASWLETKGLDKPKQQESLAFAKMTPEQKIEHLRTKVQEAQAIQTPPPPPLPPAVIAAVDENTRVGNTKTANALVETLAKIQAQKATAQAIPQPIPDNALPVTAEPPVPDSALPADQPVLPEDAGTPDPFSPPTEAAISPPSEASVAPETLAPAISGTSGLPTGGTRVEAPEQMPEGAVTGLASGESAPEVLPEQVSASQEASGAPILSEKAPIISENIQPSDSPENSLVGRPSEALSFDPQPLSDLSRDDRLRLTAVQSRIGDDERTRGLGIIVQTFAPKAQEGASADAGRGGPVQRAGVGQSAIETLRAFEQATGRRVLFIGARDGQPLPFSALTHVAFPDTIFINKDAPRHMMALIGHEWGHTVQKTNPALYEAFKQEALRQLGDAVGPMSEDRRKARYTEEQIPDELANNVIGDVFMQPEFWQKLKAHDESLWQRMVNAVTEWLNALVDKIRGSEFGTTEVIQDIEATRQAVIDLMNGSNKRPGDLPHYPVAGIDYSGEQSGLEFSADPSLDPEAIASLRQQLAQDAALLEGRSKTESEATDEEKKGPTQATKDEREYKDGSPVGPYYRETLPNELRELVVARMLDTSAMLSGGMNPEFGKRVMDYLKGGAELPGVPHNPVFQQNLAINLKYDSSLRDRLGLTESEVLAVVNPLISTLGTQAGRTLQSMSGGDLYGPLAALAEEVQAGPTKGLAEIGVTDAPKFADTIKQDAKDIFDAALPAFDEKHRTLLTKIRDNLKKIGELRARMAMKFAKNAPVPVGGDLRFSAEDIPDSELQAELDRLVNETNELLNEFFGKKKRTKKDVEKDANELLKSVEEAAAKAREKAVQKAVKGLKPAKPRDLPKRNKFVNTLIKALEDDVLDSQHVRDAFAEAYDLHGLTTERLEKLGGLLREIDAMPDGETKGTLRNLADDILNELSPNAKVMDLLQGALMGHVLGGFGTMVAQFSGITRALNPFQGAWMTLAMSDPNGMKNPANFWRLFTRYQAYIQHLKELGKAWKQIPAGLHGLGGGRSYGLGVNPSGLESLKPGSMSLTRLKWSDLYQYRAGRNKFTGSVLGSIPETPFGKGAKIAALTPAWLASRSFNFIKSAEAFTGSVDKNMAARALFVSHLMTNKGMSWQAAWNKVGDMMNPKTNAVMWNEALAQAREEQSKDLISKWQIESRAESIMQDRIDREWGVKLNNQHREISALRNFKHDPLTWAGDVANSSFKKLGEGVPAFKMLFLFPRFFANIVESAAMHLPVAGRWTMGKDRAAEGAKNDREKRIEAIYGSLEKYRQMRKSAAAGSEAMSFAAPLAMALSWALWKWLDDDEDGREKNPPPFWLTGSTPSAKAFAAQKQMQGNGWYSPNTLYLRIPGTDAGLKINYIQAAPELAMVLAAIGNYADRVMFSELLNYSTDRRTNERSFDEYKAFVEPLTSAIVAPATRSTFADFQKAFSRALDGNPQALAKLLGRPVGSTVAGMTLGGVVTKDVDKMLKPDVPRAAQNWEQAFMSGIPFAGPLGLDTGLPMTSGVTGEPQTPFSYLPFFSRSQESTPEKKKAVNLLNELGIIKEGPEEFMVDKDLIEVAVAGERLMLSLWERQEVLGDIGTRFADAVNRNADKIKAAKARGQDEARKLVTKLSDQAREAVLSKWRDHVRRK